VGKEQKKQNVKIKNEFISFFLVNDRGPVELKKKEQVLNVFIYFQLRFDSFPFHKVEDEETNGTGRERGGPLFLSMCLIQAVY